MDNQEEIYQRAISLKNNKAYSEAINEFKSILDYKDSNYQFNDTTYVLGEQYLSEGSEESLQKAKSLFKSISGWLDSDLKAAKAESEYNGLLAKQQHRRQNRKKAFIIVSVMLCISLIAFGVISLITANTKYNEAQILFDNKDYKAAAILFNEINIKDSKNKAIICAKKVLSITDIHVGDIINLNWGTWQVISIKDGKALLISRGIINTMSYGGTDWAHCTLRSYLNGSFYSNFSPIDKILISNNTGDYVSILTVYEAEHYLNQDQRSLGKRWWLKDMTNKEWVRCVDEEGCIGGNATYNTAAEGVRPTIWIDLGTSE